MEKEEKDNTIMTTLPISNPNVCSSFSKKRSSLSLLWAAIFAVRHRRRTSSKKLSAKIDIVDSSDTESVWKSLVGGIRPLHLQQLESYPTQQPLPPPSPIGHELFHNVALAPPSPTNSSYHDVALAPPSPASSSYHDVALSPPSPANSLYHDVALASPSPANSSGWMSQYASVEDLQALHEEEGIDNDKVTIAYEGGTPNAIDMQAEEFIARFYKEMKLQRLESSKRNNMMMMIE